MNPQKAWKQWCNEIEREADDVDRMADALNTFQVELPEATTDGGRGVSAKIHAVFDDVLRKKVGELRGMAHTIRKLTSEARWLGDRKRTRILEIVSLQSWAEQRPLVDSLPKVTQEAIGWSGHRLTRNNGNMFIDRIIAGARLYAATRAP